MARARKGYRNVPPYFGRDCEELRAILPMHPAAIDQCKSKIAELRFFGGLSVKGTTEVLKVSPPQ